MKPNILVARMMFPTAPARLFDRRSVRSRFPRIVRLLGLVALSLTTSVFGQPVVESISGEATQGSTIRIYGKNFSYPNRTISIKANSKTFKLSTGGSWSELSSEDELWHQKGSAWATALEPYDAGREFSNAYRGTGKAYSGWLNPLQDAGLKTIYVTWLFKPSEDPHHSRGSNKFIRVWDDSDGKHTRIAWTQMHLNYNAGPSWPNWSGTVGQWNRMEFWVDSNAGVIEARTNGVTIHHVTDFQKKETPKGLNVKLIGFDPSVTAPYAEMTFLIDGLYVSSTQARVLISDKATWAEAQIHAQIQLATDWSDREIVAVVDLDPVGNQDFRYLYVTDSFGSTNADGFDICTECPASPDAKVE